MTVKKFMRGTLFVTMLAISSLTLSGCTAAQGFQIASAVLGGIANIFGTVAGIVGGGGGGGNQPADNAGAVEDGNPPADNAAAANPTPAPVQPAAEAATVAPANTPTFTAPTLKSGLKKGGVLDTIMNADSENSGGTK